MNRCILRAHVLHAPCQDSSSTCHRHSKSPADPAPLQLGVHPGACCHHLGRGLLLAAEMGLGLLQLGLRGLAGPKARGLQLGLRGLAQARGLQLGLRGLAQLGPKARGLPLEC